MSDSSNPFAEAYQQYRQTGWTNTLWLPLGAKFPPPEGHTGAAGRTVLRDDIDRFLSRGPGNIALRLPKNIIGFDVDHYGDKRGLDELAELERVHGALPPTWYTTARVVGGVRYFRLQPGWNENDLPGQVSTSTEVIRYGHRYAIVAPSLHPDGARYRIYDPEDCEVSCLPVIGELPELPEAWWQHLTGQKAAAAPVSKLGIGGDREAALARICEHCETLARTPQGPGSDACFQTGRMIGELAAGAGIPIDEVRPFAYAALDAWTFTGKGRAEMTAQIENGLKRGPERPIAWEPALPLRGDVLFGSDEPRGESGLARGDEPAAEEPARFVFSDAALSEHIAETVLCGRFIKTRGLGWMRWTGKLWRRCDDSAPIEAVRRYVRRRYDKAVKNESGSASSWFKYSAAGKIASLVTLASGQNGILHEAEEFDTHPDLLNTPAGVLDLATLTVGPHDPELLLTKITKGCYRQGFTTPDWKTALTCVPDDALTWLQAYMGAGVSGRPKPRVPAVLLTGEGRNGKTLLMETALEALGGIDGEGYAVQVPSELLLAGKVTGGPSPEKLILRGARLAYVEETPEGRYLDVQVLKKLIGTGVVSARDLYKALVSFRLTHVMFINTNHPPRVSETDTATWDRLTSLQFPLRFRKANDGLGPRLPHDRDGSPMLAEDLQSPENLDACLTWMVEGYRAGRPDQVAVPASVEASVRDWRKDGDMLLRFMDDVFEFDADSWVVATDLYAALKRWSDAHGHPKPPPMNTFISRLKSHTGLGRKIGSRRVISTAPGLSRPMVSGWLVADNSTSVPLPRQVSGIIGVRFVSQEDTGL